jgi:hypothetical protein
MNIDYGLSKKKPLTSEARPPRLLAKEEIGVLDSALMKPFLMSPIH